MKNVEIVKLIDNCVKIKFIGVYVRIFVQYISGFDFYIIIS